jgi:hypothetical protein
MKLVEILGKDNLAKLEKKLEQFIKYDPHLTQGINYNTVTFYSKETIPLDKFEHILDSITSEGYSIIKSDNDYEVEDDRFRRPFIRFK